MPFNFILYPGKAASPWGFPWIAGSPQDNHNRALFQYDDMDYPFIAARQDGLWLSSAPRHSATHSPFEFDLSSNH